MTLFLLLGLFAGLYAIVLLFRLAVHALPIMAAIGGTFWLHDHGHGFPAAILLGSSLGLGLALGGQHLFGAARSPLVRLALGLAFAVPAGIAGYHAAGAVAGIAIEPGAVLSIVSWLGAVTVAGTAVARLADRAGTRSRVAAVPQENDRSPRGRLIRLHR